MRLAIVGSRSITEKAWVEKQIAVFMLENGGSRPEQHFTLLSGGALGVDTMVREFCKEMGIDFILFKPYHLIDNKVEFEPKYFFARNRQIVDNADKVLVLWDGKSHGSKGVIDYCIKRKKDCVVREAPPF